MSAIIAPPDFTDTGVLKVQRAYAVGTERIVQHFTDILNPAPAADLLPPPIDYADYERRMRERQAYGLPYRLREME